MRKLLISMLLVAFMATPALADDNRYWLMTGHAAMMDDVKIEGGPTFDTNMGWGFGFGSGWKFKNNYRGELEAGYDYIDGDASIGRYGLEGSLSTYTFMGSIYKDFMIGRFAPYAGGGLGVAWVDPQLDMSSRRGTMHVRDEADVVGAYKLGAGVRMPVSTMVFGAGYEYWDTFTNPVLFGREVDKGTHRLVLRVEF